MTSRLTSLEKFALCMLFSQVVFEVSLFKYKLVCLPDGLLLHCLLQVLP